ncbi:Transcription factor IIIA [Nakaseomyces bracarensis]|uniref:Transcription factor IIIA n=1 Tax=Nakaseomyces bracarensis TaxID=273131 RepID=A0ABR4NZR0_9SACH
MLSDISSRSRSSSVGSISSATSTSSIRAKNYVCEYDQCDKAFTRPSLLTEHQEVVHLGKKPWKCTQCDACFTKKVHLERHIYTHTDERPFHCSFCNKGLITKQQLKRHEITHTRSFQCDYDGCNEAFYKHPQLRAHILSVHLQKLTCPHCKKNFQRPYRLKNHIAKHHNPDVTNAYQCNNSLCSMSFKTWSALQAHVKKDHPKLKCGICGKACVGEDGLNMHMKVHDETLVSRNWKCHLCDDLSFAKKIDLVNHYNSSHPEDMPAYLTEPNRVQYIEIQTEDNNSNSFKPPKIAIQNKELLALQTEASLTSYFESGKDAMTLLLNTVGRKLRCPYAKCYRSFKTEEKYKVHIEKHKIHEAKLAELEMATKIEQS